MYGTHTHTRNAYAHKHEREERKRRERKRGGGGEGEEGVRDQRGHVNKLSKMNNRHKKLINEFAICRILCRVLRQRE
jgi:hypothetical protein